MNKILLVMLVAGMSSRLQAAPSAQSTLIYTTHLGISRAFQLTLGLGVIKVNGRPLGRSESLIKASDIAQVLGANAAKTSYGGCNAGEYTLESLRNGHAATERGCLESDRFASLLKAYQNLRQNPTPLRD